MKHRSLNFDEGFRLSVKNERSQAAEMVIAAGEREGGSQNRHDGSDQWLFVIDGTGSAIVNGHHYPLSPGSLMLIERGDTHEIRADARGALRTLNLYVPPAYADEETTLPAERPSER